MSYGKKGTSYLFDLRSKCFPKHTEFFDTSHPLVQITIFCTIPTEIWRFFFLVLFRLNWMEIFCLVYSNSRMWLKGRHWQQNTQWKDPRGELWNVTPAPFWREKHTFHLSRHLKFHLKSKHSINLVWRQSTGITISQNQFTS